MSHTRTLDPATPSAACLGAVLRRLRTLQGLTQADLGRLAGYGGSYINAVSGPPSTPPTTWSSAATRCSRPTVSS